MIEELKSNAKEDLSIRLHLVDTAVGFLLNHDVKHRPDDAKITFLKNKGLSGSEIAEAFNKAKFQAGTVSNQGSQMMNAYPLPPYRTPNSFWFHLRNCSSIFGSFAVAVYVLHRFYKSYIEPWLFGSKSEQSEISALKQQLTELNNSVSRLTSTVSSLEESVHNQIHQINTTSLYGVESVPKSVRDILEEISNVKSLLLNRFSFPAPPTLMGTLNESKTQKGESKAAVRVVTIPKWQLRGSEHGKSKEQLDESEAKEKSSSEPSSLGNSLSSLEDQMLDQENNLKIAKDKIQDEDSKTASENNGDDLEDKNENSKECLENNLSAKGKTENEDSKTAVENQIKSIDKDSGVESHNYLLDTDQTSERNGSSKKSE